jgi:hypothetical protein
LFGKRRLNKSKVATNEMEMKMKTYNQKTRPATDLKNYEGTKMLKAKT